jgi:hypothetical protein
VTLPTTPIIRWRRGTPERWFEMNPVLRSGEPGYEMGTGRFKVGDGVTEWEDLPYFVPGTTVISDPESSATEGPSITESIVLQHIYDDMPHPVYDDGPSLLLLYENAKV